jgi:hypothetical protein
MKIIVYAVAGLVFFFLGGSVLPAADFDKEFLNRPWGSPISEFPEFVHVGGSGKIGHYINPKQAYMVFGTQLTELVYGFYEEKFFAVYARLEAIDAYSSIKHQIQERLGLPKLSMETRGELSVYSWKTGDTRIKMKTYGDTGAMKLSFYYLPIARLANSEIQKEMDEEPPEPRFPLSVTRQKEAVQLLELFDF